MDHTDALRDHLARALSWGEAHVSLDDAAAGLPAALRGTRPDGAPHSAWELVEHLRITQRDLLDFCTAERYEARAWPDEYWPPSPAPPDAAAWEASVAASRADRAALARLACDPTVDLAAAARHGGEGQTVLRALLLALDHAAYHVGQLVALRRQLGAWPPPAG